MHRKQYKFTIADVAAATGRTEAQVQYDRRSGTFDPERLRSLVAYVASFMLKEKK